MVGHIQTHVRKILTAWYCFMCAKEMPAEEESLMNLLSVVHIQYKWSSLIPYANLRNVAASCSGTYAPKQSLGMSTILDHDSSFQCCNIMPASYFDTAHTVVTSHLCHTPTQPLSNHTKKSIMVCHNGLVWNHRSVTQEVRHQCSIQKTGNFGLQHQELRSGPSCEILQNQHHSLS